MTAITIAERSTLIWGDDALGPKNLETASLPSEDQLKERRIYEVEPDLEHHVDVEWGVLDNWVAFKLAPHFTEQIYKSQPLAIDTETAIREHIIPEYKEAQGHYLADSADIVSRQMPGVKRSIKQYGDEVRYLQESVEYSQRMIDAGDTSPKLRLDVASWQKQAKEKQGSVSRLSQDIKKLEANVRMKEALFYKINDFVHRLDNGEKRADIDVIVFNSKKIALEQVIISYKSARALVDSEDEELEIVRGYDIAIQTLTAELSALEALASKPDNVIEFKPKTVDGYDEAIASGGRLKEMRQKLFGGFGAKAAALYGALARS